MPSVSTYVVPEDTEPDDEEKNKDEFVPQMVISSFESLEEMRKDIQAAGFTTKLPRAESDDPVIVESWMR